MAQQINPAEDGVTHINVYSKGATELGRLLSNFAQTPFEHPIFGHFESMEGYWYYIRTGFQFGELKYMHGHAAKVHGKQEEVVPFPHFEAAILDGIRCKLRQNRGILKLLEDSTLPLTHYYWYGTVDNPKVIDQPQHQWQIDEIERIRAVMHAL